MTPEQFAAIITALGLLTAGIAKLIYEVRQTRRTTEAVNHAVNNRLEDAPTLVELAETNRATIEILVERMDALTKMKYTSAAWERLATARMDRLDSTLAEILAELREKKP